jgi:hypothetical protein
VPATGRVRYAVSGTGADQRLTIQWDGVQFYFTDGTDTLSFQAQLYADGRIRFNYRDLTGGSGVEDEGRSATIGLKAAGQQGERTLVSFNDGPNQFVGSLKSTTFTPVVNRNDLYSFAASGGEVVSLAVRGAGVGLELLDATGAVVATGVGVTGEVDRAIERFTVAGGGTYFARIAGVETPYTLVVTRNAAFDFGSNRTTPTARSLSGTGAVFGAVAAGDYVASSIAYTFDDIAATGPVITALTGVDDRSVSIPVGFAFPFFGEARTNVFVSSNGLLTFGSGNASFANTDLSTAPAEAAIAPFWDDLVVPATGRVRYAVSGTGADQRLTIQWDGVQFYFTTDGTDTLSFQAQLYADGRIRFNYRDLAGGSSALNDGRSATVGVKAAGPQGPQRTLVSFNNGPNQFVGSLKSVRIDPTRGDWYAVTAPADGTPLRLASSTPDGRLDPRLELYDAAGTTLIASGMPLADGRNESLVVTGGLAGGSYLVRVSGEAASIGDYLLGFADAATGAPTGIALSAAAVAENQPAGTVIGTFTTSDPQAADTFTYTLVSGAGAADNARFAIVGNALVTTSPFDFEARASYSARVRSTDAGGLWTERAFTIAVVDGDDGPVITGVAATVGYVENATPAVTAAAAVVADRDSPQLGGGNLTVTIVANGEAADRLAIRNQGTAAGQVGVSGGTVTFGGVAVATVAGGAAGSSPLVVTFSAAVTPAIAQAILRNVTYANVSDAPSTMPRTLSYQVSDGAGGTSAAVQQTVTVVAVNDAPVLGGMTGPLTYVENATLLVTPAATVFDVDSADFATGRLTVRVATNASSADRLTILHQGTGSGEVGVSGTTVSFGGVAVGTLSGGAGTSALVVTFNSAATPAAVQAVTRRVAFSIASDAPTILPRTLTFSLTDGDGGTSATTSQVVNVEAVNDAPTLSGVPATAAYRENANLLTAPSGLVTDPDSPQLGGGNLTVTIVANGEAADRLAIRNQGTAAGQVGVSGGTVTFGGVAVATVAGGAAGSSPLVVTFSAAVTPAIAQTILRNVTYANVSDAPSTLPRTLSYQVTDGAGGTSATVQQTVTVVAVNDAPVLGGMTGPLTYVENATLLVTPAATVFDVDSADFATGRLTVRVATNASSADRLTILQQGTGSGEVGVSGTTVTFGGIAIGTVSGASSVSMFVGFNSAATPAAVQAVVRRVAFQITSDAPTILPRTLTFSLTDGDGGTSATTSQVVNVEAVNDAPTLSGVPVTAAYTENAAPTLTAPAGLVTDPDSPQLGGGNLTVTIAANGEAADRLAIRNQGTAAGQVGVSDGTVTFGGVAVATVAGGDAGSGPLVVTFSSAVTPAIAQAILRNVTYANASDAPSTLPRTLSYQMTDGAGGTSAVVRQTVTVAAVNDAPVLGGIATSGLVYGGPGPLTLAAAGTVADVDSATFGGGSLQVAIVAGGLASDRLLIRSQGTAPGQVSVAGGTVSYGGVAIGTVAGGTGLTALVINLNGSATVEAVQALLRAIAYESVAVDPTNGGLNATRTIGYTLRDAPAASRGLATVVQQSLAFA